MEKGSISYKPPYHLALTQYYVENDHEAIIPRDIFMRVQEELVRRRVVKTSANGKKRTYSCNHCFSQLIVCGECGEMFRRILGTTAAANPSYGAASAGWKQPAWNTMPGRSMSRN